MPISDIELHWGNPTDTILAQHLDPAVYEYGFADLSGLLPPKYTEFASGISILRKLDDATIDAINDGPTKDYYKLYNCGSCAVCVVQCPARAANGTAWSVGIHRDKYYDAFKCRDYCRTISKAKIDMEISLCGKCVAVCPKGKGTP